MAAKMTWQWVLKERERWECDEWKNLDLKFVRERVSTEERKIFIYIKIFGEIWIESVYLLIVWFFFFLLLSSLSYFFFNLY
jgi:hypothetical protein